MSFIIEILIITLLIFLFCVFVLSKDDFVLLRKNVSLEELFNITIVGWVIATFMSRLGFVLGHPNIRYINPLVFLAFPYFPGLSLSSGIVGFCLYVFLYTQKKKFPIKRIFDVFTTAFAASLSIGSLLLFLMLIFTHSNIQIIFLIEFFVYGLCFFALLWLCAKSKIRDGDTSIFGTIFICLTQVVFLASLRGKHTFLKVGFDDIIFLVEAATLIFLFFKISRKTKRSN